MPWTQAALEASNRNSKYKGFKDEEEDDKKDVSPWGVF